MLSIKKPGETITVTFDFSALGASVSSPVVTSMVSSGVGDPSPSSILIGQPAISGSKVLQQVSGGVSGTYYELQCAVTMGSNVYELADVLPIVQI
jgi:hypothetical protein